MDLLTEPPVLNLYDNDKSIFSRNPVKPPHYIAEGAVVKNSCVTEGCNVFGEIYHSILFEGVTVKEGAVIKDSIIFPGATIGKNTLINKAIIGENAVIGDGCSVGIKENAEKKSSYCTDGISVVSGGITLSEGTTVYKEEMVTRGGRRSE